MKRLSLSEDATWLSDDQSFEKMADLMSQNHCKLLGLYDELPMFFSQINIKFFRGHGLSESHELAVFLQLYGAEQWMRKTGNEYLCILNVFCDCYCIYLYSFR